VNLANGGICPCTRSPVNPCVRHCLTVSFLAWYRDAVDEHTGIGGSYYDASYTAEETRTFTAQFSAITQKMADSLAAGLPAESEQMQAAVREHYDFCLRFWTPDREAFKALALNYVLPTGYRDTYEGWGEGLGRYVYEAVCHFADTQLA